MVKLCYLCSKPATKALELKESFTNHSLSRVPTSTNMCDRCHSTIAGEQKQLWYWNEGKGKWSKVWGRSLSRIYEGDRLVVPIIEGKHTEGKDTFKVVKNLLTRAAIRDYLLNPPQPPFTIVIAESGQKHILPWAKEANSRCLFPVQFELDSLYINHPKFVKLLGDYESLMGMGFSKAEIDSGEYRSDRLLQAYSPQFNQHEEAITLHRGTRLLQLCSFVASLYRGGELYRDAELDYSSRRSHPL